jgi:hypothetical protein
MSTTTTTTSSSTAGTSPTPTANSYYTQEMLEEIWDPAWFENLFCKSSAWYQVDPKKPILNPIHPNFQMYHPFVCHACKRGPLTGTLLYKCAKCRIVQYCCREHQIHDWKFHKPWCLAFQQLIQQEQDENNDNNNMMAYGSREEWFQALPRMTQSLMRIMDENQHRTLQRHSDEIQIAIGQPRCRKCYRAGIDRNVKLIPCPKCNGVALCETCYDADPASASSSSSQICHRFHLDSENPVEDCRAYLLALCCSGMIVEQGNPLGLPSANDCLHYWKPNDWRDYFSRQRHNYELPSPLFNLAPVPTFLSDAHSTMMTVHHILSLPEMATEDDNENTIPPEKRTKLVVHLCGAAVNDEFAVGRYVEMIRLNPSLLEFQIHLIGPTIQSHDHGLSQMAIQAERIRPSCRVTVHKHRGLYHDIFARQNSYQDRPDIVICPHSGIHEPAYTESWHPTILFLCKRNVPFVLTGFTFQEVVRDTTLMEAWGAHILIQPTLNPFHGLRPFIDPSRDPVDIYYGNSAFVVAKGVSSKSK